MSPDQDPGTAAPSWHPTPPLVSVIAITCVWGPSWHVPAVRGVVNRMLTISECFWESCYRLPAACRSLTRCMHQLRVRPAGPAQPTTRMCLQSSAPPQKHAWAARAPVRLPYRSPVCSFASLPLCPHARQGQGHSIPMVHACCGPVAVQDPKIDV